MTSKPVAQMLADLGVKKRIAGATSQTTPHIQKASSKLSRTGPSSPTDPGQSEMRVAFLALPSLLQPPRHHSGLPLLAPGMLHYGMASQIIEQQ
jgi:hypothetical protein